MARRQIEWPTVEDRTVAALNGALADAINSDRSEVTPVEVREDARALGEFLRLRMAMDAEQKIGDKNVG